MNWPSDMQVCVLLLVALYYYRVVGTSVEDAGAVLMGRNVIHFAATVIRMK